MPLAPVALALRAVALRAVALRAVVLLSGMFVEVLVSLQYVGWIGGVDCLTF